MGGVLKNAQLAVLGSIFRSVGDEKYFSVGQSFTKPRGSWRQTVQAPTGSQLRSGCGMGNPHPQIASNPTLLCLKSPLSFQNIVFRDTKVSGELRLLKRFRQQLSGAVASSEGRGP